MMAEEPVVSVAVGTVEGFESMRKYSLWLAILGGILVICGLVAVISAPFVAGVTAVLLVGILLLISSATQIVDALVIHRWNGFLHHLLAGVLYGIIGLMIIRRPGLAMEALTLLIAMFLMVGGLTRLFVAILTRFDRWGLVFVNGLVTFALGILIWMEWPWSGLWVVGTFVGVEMIVAGWSLAMLSAALRAK
jgi:uncharacterized membrane protein HdeD (DUF308 family)